MAYTLDMVSGPFGNLSLPPELERFIAEGVSSGRFASANDVVVGALLLLREHEAWKADARQKIEEGWQASEHGDVLDGSAFMAELQSRIDRGEFDRAKAG